jgi:AraC-like DNA-binding protein
MQISIWLVRMLAGALADQGVDRAHFLRRAGIAPDLLADGEARLSIADYTRALDAALELSSDPVFGLHVGERLNPQMFDVLGHMAHHATTLRESIQTIVDYSQLAAEGYGPELREHGSTASLRFPALTGDWPVVRFTAEFALCAWLRTPRVFVGEHAWPSQVCFTYPAPREGEEYQRVFEGRACFKQPFTGVVFSREWLDVTQLYASPDLFELLKSRADGMLGRLERRALSQRVEQLLAAHDPRVAPHVADLARSLDMSERSLRRRLSEEGTSYGELLERARISAAKRLLERPRASIQETAYALGFAAPNAFHRAFKRWTGLTPRQYRATF